VSSKREGAVLVGAGVAACAVCCAGPILGVLAAIGLGTLAGVALFGSIGFAIAALGFIVIVRRRRRVAACSTDNEQRVELVQRR
jgi:hypothetical protein